MAFIVYLLSPTAIILIQVRLLACIVIAIELYADVFGCFVQEAIFTWEQDWIVFTLNELIVLLMFFHVGVNFSPVHENLITRAFDGTFNAIHNE